MKLVIYLLAIVTFLVSANFLLNQLPDKPRFVCQLQYKPHTKVTVIEGSYSGVVGTITGLINTSNKCGYIVQIKLPNSYLYQKQDSPFIKYNNVTKQL